MIAHIVRGQEVGCSGRAVDGRVCAAGVGIPLIGERQGIGAIGIGNARGVRRQGLALGGRAGDGR